MRLMDWTVVVAKYSNVPLPVNWALMSVMSIIGGAIGAIFWDLYGYWLTWRREDDGPWIDWSE